MARITIEDCLDQHSQPLRADARRHQPRAADHRRLGAAGRADRDKPTVIALREIAAGKVGIEMLLKAAELTRRASERSDAARVPGMSEIAEFTRHLGNYLPPPDVALVERAFEFSESAHRGQFRKSGEPYITHPLAVASILSQWRLDAQGLAAALLHDVMEDTSVTKARARDDVRQAGRRHGRRRLQARPDRVHVARGGAGRELPQDAARDGAATCASS